MAPPGGDRKDKKRISPWGKLLFSFKGKNIAIISVFVAIGAFLFFAFSGSKKKEEILAFQSDVISAALYRPIACRSSHDPPLIEGCTPQSCGRFVVDDLIPMSHVQTLIEISQRGMNFSEGGSGGPTILDLHSGALSKGEQFIDVFAASRSDNVSFLDENSIETYREVKEAIMKQLVQRFNLSFLYLTKPTFFSRITNKPARTQHDEYWHLHIDKLTYGSFVYTCLLYLSDHGVHFTGGEFEFQDQAEGNKNIFKSIVQPKKGRLSCFTSGDENKHLVRKVKSGERLALTISFTCSPSNAIPDPSPRFSVSSPAVPDNSSS